MGTSGWIYPSWRGPFYPLELRQKDRFAYYAQQFDTAEINATFYRLPSQATVAAWREGAPANFVFSWKASRFITQAKKLLEAETPLARVYAPMLALGEKLGPALFQLPPQLHLNLPRLASFLPLLPSEHRHVVEFRHPSWYVDPVFELLEKHGVALCVSDHCDAPAPWRLTAGFAYVRGHGPGGRYYGSYTDDELAHWARWIAEWRSKGHDVYAYFDNDIGCAAPGDALRLRRMAGEPDEPAVEGTIGAVADSGGGGELCPREN